MVQRFFAYDKNCIKIWCKCCFAYHENCIKNWCKCWVAYNGPNHLLMGLLVNGDSSDSSPVLTFLSDPLRFRDLLTQNLIEKWSVLGLDLFEVVWVKFVIHYLNFEISKRSLAIPWSTSQNFFLKVVHFVIGPFLSGLSKIRHPLYINGSRILPLPHFWDFKVIPGDSVIC